MTLQSPARKKLLLIFVPLALWSLFLWRAVHVFTPRDYNSDAAIPVMMSNEERPVTVFSLYYYAADRWGGWPLLATKLVHYMTGHEWSDEGLLRLQVIWIFVGVLVLASLSRRDRIPLGLIYVLTLCLNSESGFMIFELSQLYAWQLTALLLGWYSLRRFFESYFSVTGKDDPGRKAVLWGGLTLWFSFLAIWSSIASTPFLSFLFCAEAWRVYLKKGGHGLKGPLRGYVYGAAFIMLAAVAELLQKKNYHRYSAKHFGFEYKTEFGLDIGYLAMNLKTHLHHLGQLSWLPLYLLPAIALLAFGLGYFYASLKKRDELLKEMRSILSNDTAILIIELYGIAFINLILVIITSHVRLSDYNSRFLTVTYLFGPASGMLTLFLMFDLTAGAFHSRRLARPALILAGLLFLTLKFPPKRDGTANQLVKETAITLSRKAPHGVLMGGYWETYIFTHLQTTDQMTPIPVEGQLSRTPWTYEHLRQAAEVVVEYRHSGLGGPEVSPPAHLNQHGSSLRLVEPRWYENGGYAFALYLNENVGRLSYGDGR